MTPENKDLPRSFLSRAFSYAKGMHPVNKVLLAVALITNISPQYTLGPAVDFYRDQTALKTSDLTSGEAALVRAVFGDDFDTSTIRKRYSGNQAACGQPRGDEVSYVACVRRGSDRITFAAPYKFMDDYSQDGSMSGGRVSTFMHEATHIWQFRTNAANGGECHTYNLPEADIFNRAMTFDHYCTERQAELVGYYAAFYLRPSPFGKTDLTSNEGRYVDRIRAIVEAKFPRAAQLRAQMQTRASAHLNCFNTAANDQNAQNACNVRYYTNLRGQALTTAPEHVTFTLPNGQVRYPVVEAARRNGELPAARPSS